MLYLDWPDTVHPAWFVLPFAALFGWLVFGETPHLAAMQGAVVIAAAGL